VITWKLLTVDRKTDCSLAACLECSSRADDVIVVTVFIALFLYCTFKIYSALRLFSRKCVINSVFSVLSAAQNFASSVIKCNLCRGVN